MMTQRTKPVNAGNDGPPSWTPPVSGLPIAYGQAVELTLADGTGVSGWLEWCNDVGGCLRPPKEHGDTLRPFDWRNVVAITWTAIREHDTR